MAKKNSKGLGVSIIMASLILAAAIIYGFNSLSSMLLAPNQPVQEPDRLIVQENDHIKGEKDALVTIIEFSDFQDPFSKEFYKNLKKLTNEYGDKVSWVYRHFPVVSIHPEAKIAAIASECAYKQGSFWQYAEGLFNNQDDLNKETYLDIAENLNLNVVNFQNCLESQEFDTKIRKDYKQGLELGINGTPTTFINKETMVGAISYNALKAEVESILEEIIPQKK